METPRFEAYQAYTPADDVKAPDHDAIYVAAAGDIAVKQSASSTAVVFTVVAGSLLPIKAWSIQNTATDATSVILLRNN